jgi:hypothetical protein
MGPQSLNLGLDFDNPADWHGHLRPRPDGARAKCGALGVLGCPVCREEDRQMKAMAENASISGIAPVAAGVQGGAKPQVLSAPFPSTAFGGSEKPTDASLKKRKLSEEDDQTEAEIDLGL